MSQLSVLLIPAIAALLAYVMRSDRIRPWLLPIAGAAHLQAAVQLIAEERRGETGTWLHLDPVGRVVLLTISVLFLCCAFYAPGYLKLRASRPNRLFCASLLLLLAVMSLVTLAEHLGLMWVAIEATTLVSGPLIYFNKTPRSLEAAWKYLLICSVGVALALLGSFFLAYASLEAGEHSTLLFGDLVRSADKLSKPWLHGAFALLLVGYGTKMGLAPMHTWKPDAYGEAPGLVGALLAGGVTSCAFLAIMRFTKILFAAGEGAHASKVLVCMGLISMLFAAAFLMRQRDFKRMLAYSSVEHMGILVLGVGLGGGALFGALLHLVGGALAKGVLFLAAGNIHRSYGSKLTDDVSGALAELPYSSGLFLAGFLAATGAPPFGLFVSELIILRGAIADGHYAAAGAFLVLLLMVFLGMGMTLLSVVFGQAPPGAKRAYRDGPATVLPIAVLLVLVLVLGVYVPPPLVDLLREAADSLAMAP